MTVRAEPHCASSRTRECRDVPRCQVDGWYLAEQSDGILNRSRKNLPYGLLVFKLYFRLRGVYVHINVCRLHIEIDEVRHLHAHRQKALKGVHHCLMEIGMLHVSAVYKEILVRPLLARRLRLAHKSADTADGCIDIYRQDILIEAFAKHVGYALAQTSGAQVEHLRAVALQSKRDGRIYEYDALISREDIVELGSVGL